MRGEQKERGAALEQGLGGRTIPAQAKGREEPERKAEQRKVAPSQGVSLEAQVSLAGPQPAHCLGPSHLGVREEEFLLGSIKSGPRLAHPSLNASIPASGSNVPSGGRLRGGPEAPRPPPGICSPPLPPF